MIINVNDLSFSYSQKDDLFKNLTLYIEQGGICGLLGKNGSGKTTLLKIIAGLIFPKSGSCQVLQQIPKDRNPAFLEKIYFLPEDIYVPAITADTYIKLYASFYPKFDIAAFNNYLTEFDLPNNKLLINLSHGQKKKFLIAFGLATNSQLLILDEPTNGLDIPSKTQFRKLLAANISEERLFIISTHQVHDVENIIDSTIILDEGKIAFHQTILNITKKLAFQLSPSQPNLNECLYYEKHLAGYTVLSINNNFQNNQINL